MGYVQVRHAKLWFAGDKENWPLAAYELDELKEGFEDITKFHPTHEKIPFPTAQALHQFMDLPLRQLSEAIAQEKKGEFLSAFANVNTSCNACHQQCNFGFIHIQNPNTHPYSNQDYGYKPQ